MAGVRMTMTVRNLDGLRAKVRAQTQRQKEHVRTATALDMEATFDLAQALCNRDTGFAASKMFAELTRDGFNWVIGFRASDFIGQTNTLASPARLVTEFYIRFVIEGTRFMAGNDFLATAFRLRVDQRRLLYQRALIA